MLIGAIDLGGTKIRSLVFDDAGKVAGEDERATRAEDGPNAVLGRMVHSLRAALGGGGAIDRLAIVGVASPGPIDLAHGVVMRPPNLPGWDAVPLRDHLASAFGCPVLVENDANAAAWGEFRHGAGRGTAHMVYLTVSTGIGGGLVLDGRLYRGADGAAGEIGHIPLLVDGPPCGCGARGCLEALASGSAIARAAREALLKGRARSLSAQAAQEAVTAEQVHRAALAGDPDCHAIVAEAGRFLGLGLAAVTNLFNPEVIVLGGGVTNMGAMLLEPALAVLRERAMRPARDRVRVTTTELGDRAGVMGVAELAREHRGRVP